MPEAPCRAVIYARLSLSDLESEGDQSRAVQRQVSACRDRARAKGLEVAEVHTDDGISAYAGSLGQASTRHSTWWHAGRPR